ncbi:MAG TPA: Hpt domain-containing protein, partial [Burkholderiales bacterium]|nr:Hpt domain-containing protein [Burkholderiales bacterium]
PAPVAEAAIKGLVSRLAGNARLRPIIRKFPGRLREKLAALGSGSSEPGCEEIGAFAHWLAGSAGSVGYDDLSELARRLEQHARNSEREQVRRLLTELRAVAPRIVVPDENEFTASRATA